VVRRGREFVEQCLEDAQRQGSVDPRLPASSLALLVMGAVQVQCGRREESPEAAWLALKALLCAGGREGSERRREG